MNEVLAEPTTKERIVQATLKIISDEGFASVTVRKIAALAGVNVAAVNYHFGCKDLAINEALKYVTSQLIGVFQILKQRQEPGIRLESFIREYANMIYQYPDIIEYFIDQKIHTSNSRFAYGEFLENEGIGLIKQTISELLPGEPEKALYIRTLQLVSGICFPVLIGKAMTEISGLNLNDPTDRLAYIKLLINGILASPRY